MDYKAITLLSVYLHPYSSRSELGYEARRRLTGNRRQPGCERELRWLVLGKLCLSGSRLLVSHGDEIAMQVRSLTVVRL